MKYLEINKIYNESTLDTLNKMPDAYLDCVVTSPPYWQLRDYGYDGQWGLEPTFQEYLEHLWSMMDLIYKKLKPSGTVWINLGDTYNGNKVSNTSNLGYGNSGEVINLNKSKDKVLKNKTLLLIPHRFAIGCMEKGWIIRNDCIWAKRNAMPESVTDRFSKKHEYFFFMVKQEKYYFNLDAIRDKLSDSSIKRYDYEWNGNADRDYIKGSQNNMSKFMGDTTKKQEAIDKGKNPGDVSDFWDVVTKKGSEKHYASYNDSLLVKPVLAGCPEGGLIYDTFMGTGSTAEVSLRSNRKFIGSEMSVNYCKIANERLKPFLIQKNLL